MNRTQDRPSASERKALESLTREQRDALAAHANRRRPRTVRRKASREFLGMPLYAIATGPDPARGEKRGHAKGVIAIGDIATGIVALGGWARGVVALGGVATGLVSFGGLSIGLLASLGGLAISAVLAFGGGAIGTIAVGGGAVGHYATGGAAVGNFVASPRRTDAEAIAFFRELGIELPANRAATAPRR